VGEANLRVPLMDVDAHDLGALAGVLFITYEDGSEDAYSLGLSSTSPTSADNMSFVSLLGILVSAFLGGLILNLMPCVFPVLSLKVASLVGHAHSKSARNHMLIFVTGVLASFLTLAALLSILRIIGLGVGWGFQFQSPVFVALMIILTFVLGLNLAGVFEVGLSLQTKAGSVQVSERYIGSFMSGVLATTLATPCTAPFMGSAIAYALTAPLWGVFGVFVALGLGMGSPFLVLAISPALMRFLPQPGAWMESFKQALAFPMFATSVWLMSVLGAQEGINSMTMCAFGLIIVSISVWQLGRWGALHQPLRVRRISRAFGAAFAILGIWVALPQGNNAEAAQPAQVHGENSIEEAFTPARVRELKAEGKNIMVDFTAAWCIVCKVNHARVITSSPVQSLLTKKNVAVLKADWTRRDPAITEALQSLRKSGVPLIVLYPAGDRELVQFDGLISTTDFQKALEALP
jgi:thiol:disulfide interchange protein DsbD